MIIPVLCVSCNTLLASKWLLYLEKVKEFKKKDKRPENDEMEYLTESTDKTAEGRALDYLGLKKVCCRRHMLTHVDIF
jgi:DNA-directed RNA polymerase subunit N (RpoN/RPB10)